MAGADVSSLFSRAERAFVQGRLEDARRDLIDVQRVTGADPVVLQLFALVEKKRGALDSARQAFASALRLAPNNPQLSSNYANLLAELGQPDEALEQYDRALAAAPGFHDARYNRALLLQKLDRLPEALAELDRLAGAVPGDAKVHSARASVLRALGRLKDSAQAFDRSLALNPSRFVARYGRARVAMERGEDGAAALLRQVLAINPADLEVRRDLAEALEMEGDPTAINVLAEGVAQQPGWVSGQKTLARMRWEAGDGRAFTRDLEQALESQPTDRELWIAYVSALAEADLSAEAADAAAKAQSHVGADPQLMLMEAIRASEAGQAERADQLFAAAPADLPGRKAAEARHRMRCGDYQAGETLLERARDEEPWDIYNWALTGLVWRLIGDSRAQWLLEQQGLVDARPLPLGEDQLAAIADRLRSLHRTRSHPIGQSLRGGTQTRGRLFEREEPEIATLREAIAQSVKSYWDELPAADPKHPLLRHKNKRPAFTGSWSVRLTGGGFHVSHFHPMGLVSSACYFVVPQPKQPKEGWLEIGGPPGGLDVPVEPLRLIEPAVGRMALFPSFMFHGTRPFTEGERLTCAFDIVAQ